MVGGRGGVVVVFGGGGELVDEAVELVEPGGVEAGEIESAAAHLGTRTQKLTLIGRVKRVDIVTNKIYLFIYQKEKKESILYKFDYHVDCLRGRRIAKRVPCPSFWVVV